MSLGYGLEYLPSQDGIPMDEHLKIVYLSIYAHENGKVFNANVRFLGGVRKRRGAIFVVLKSSIQLTPTKGSLNIGKRKSRNFPKNNLCIHPANVSTRTLRETS